MKIVIALTSASRQIAGVQRHGINLARCLLTRSEITAVHLIIASWQRDCLNSIHPICDTRLSVHTVELRNTSVGRNLWYYTKLPQIAAGLEADVVHLAYPMPVHRRRYYCPTVVTLHDLYPHDAPGNFGVPKVLFNKAVLRQCLQSVDAIACVSRSTHERLVALSPQVARSKSTVILNSVEPQSDVSVDSPIPGWAGESFLLCVAQHRPNKNLMLLLRIFQRLVCEEGIDPKVRLVIIGIHGPQTRAIQRFLADAHLEKRVTLLTGIPDEAMQWCYRNCNLLIAPSMIEGFGLPVAEGLLAGCRVVCSDIQAFREIGGDFCEYILLNENAEQAFATAVREAYRLPRPEPVVLPQLSMANAADRYLQLYRSLLQPAASPDALALKPTTSTSRGSSSV